MTSYDVKQHIKGLKSIPTIPMLLGKILSIIGQDDSSPQELYSLISHDQALAERIVRVANSAVFGHSGEVKDIRQAVMFLGYDRIKSIAISMSVADMFPSRGSFDIKNLWVHSYEVAFISAAISDNISVTSPKECFLAGLLHDIGRIIFYNIEPRKFLKIGTSDDMFDKEVELFGCTHAEAGAWFVEGSGIPPEIFYATMLHHTPSHAKDCKDVVSIVSLAEVFSRQFSPKFEDDGIWTEEHDALLLEYSLKEDDIVSIGEEFKQSALEIQGFFSDC